MRPKSHLNGAAREVTPVRAMMNEGGEASERTQGLLRDAQSLTILQ